MDGLLMCPASPEAGFHILSSSKYFCWSELGFKVWMGRVSFEFGCSERLLCASFRCSRPGVKNGQSSGRSANSLPHFQKSSVQSCINRPFPQNTLRHVTAWKGVNNTIINGWIPFNSFRFCRVLVLCTPGPCHTVMANGGHMNGAEPLLKLFYAFPTMTGQNVCC